MKPNLVKSKAYQALPINEKINLKIRLKQRQRKYTSRIGKTLLISFFGAVAASILHKNLNPDCKD